MAAAQFLSPRSKTNKKNLINCAVLNFVYILFCPLNQSESYCRCQPTGRHQRLLKISAGEGGCYFFLSRNAVKRPVEDHVMFMSSHNYSNYEKTAWKFYSSIEMICFHGNAQNTLKISFGKVNSIDMLRGQRKL